MEAQDMDNEKLHAIFYTLSDEMEGQDGQWQFIIDSTMFLCMTDKLHNRMRIISPIVEMDKVTSEQVSRCMEANFHSALDGRYAVSDNIMWAAFIHPLKELTKEQVFSAISQVYSCARTFGTMYSSGSLSFPTKEERKYKSN
jgi:hypothetical protein